MKSKPFCVLVIILGLAAINQMHAQGYIVPNGITVVGNVPSLGTEIHVLQNPTNGDYTGFFLTPIGKTQPTVYTNTFQFNPFLDEGVRTFLVPHNQLFSLQAIQIGSYTELLYSNSSVFNDGAQFYLGFYTGYNPFTNGGVYTGIYTDPLFGWARLVNNQGVIQLLDSALAYGSGGIYVGTQNMIPVPEPAGFTLLFLSGVAYGILRLRKQRP